VKIYTKSLCKVFENEYIKGEGRCQDVLKSTKTPCGIEDVDFVYKNQFKEVQVCGWIQSPTLKHHLWLQEM